MPAAPPLPRRPPAPPAPPRGPSWRRRLRLTAIVFAALVVAVDGTAWGLYRDVTAGIVTTDVISGGSAGGDQNILLVGVDSREDAQGDPLPQAVLDRLHAGPDTGVLNTDTIIVLHVPADGGAAVAFSIPRDSYVDIPGYRRDKINAAYPATTALTAQQLVASGVHDRAEVKARSAAAGRSALIKTVEDLTGLTVDHYAEINLLGFANLTEAIGGVQVCLNAPVNDPLSGADFPAGVQTLAGPDALSFVRQRHGLAQGDLSRIRRQQVFLAAVAKKILSAGTLTDPAALSRLVGVAQRSLVIDKGWDLLAFARQASDIAAGHLEFLTIPTTGTQTNDRGDVVTVDRGRVRDFVDQKIAEQKAAAQAAAAQAKADAARPKPQPLDIITSHYVTDVRNGSAKGGLAAQLAAHLQKLGFSRGTVDNTGPTATSVVRYTGSDAHAAEQLASQLGGIDTESVGSDVTAPGHLLVIIGDDFDERVLPAPTTAPAPPPPAAPTAPITAAGVPCVD